MKLKIVFIVLFALIPLTTHAAISDATRRHLSTTQDRSAWTILAQSANDLSSNEPIIGTGNAFELAKTILAITAARRDPTKSSSGDLVARLKTREFHDGQIGEIAYANDDAWGVLALRAAGVPASDRVVVSAIQYMRDAQHTRGGWSWSSNASTQPDIDDTAAVIMALRAAGVSKSDPAIQRAVGLLFQSQNDDGGFSNMIGGGSNVDSTAWAVLALRSLGEDMSSWKRQRATPVDYLLTAEHADGAWGNPRTTGFSALALSNKTIPVNAMTYSASVMQEVVTSPQPSNNQPATGNTQERVAQQTPVTQAQPTTRVAQQPLVPRPIAQQPSSSVFAPTQPTPVVSPIVPRWYAAPSLFPVSIAPSVGVNANTINEIVSSHAPRDERKVDSDGDGFDDATEIEHGFDPYDATPCPAKVYSATTRTAYGTARLSSLEQESCRSWQLRKTVETMIRGSVGVSATRWNKLTNAFLYGGYTAQDIAMAVRGARNIH